MFHSDAFLCIRRIAMTNGCNLMIFLSLEEEQLSSAVVVDSAVFVCHNTVDKGVRNGVRVGVTLERRPSAARQNLVGGYGVGLTGIDNGNVGIVSLAEVSASRYPEECSRGMTHLLYHLSAGKMTFCGEFEHGLQ